MLKRLGTDGRCDPSQATLATDAGCDERTVRRALKALKAAGLLAWEQRVVRCPWPAGGPGAIRAEQTSNAYELLIPWTPVAPRTERRRCEAVCRSDCGGQLARETPPKLISNLLPELSEAEQHRLEAIQAARKARREQEWLRERSERWRLRS